MTDARRRRVAAVVEAVTACIAELLAGAGAGEELLARHARGELQLRVRVDERPLAVVIAAVTDAGEEVELYRGTWRPERRTPDRVQLN